MIVTFLPRGSAQKPPNPCTVLTATASLGQIVVTWVDPALSEVIGGSTVVWAGTKLVRKEGSASTSWEDGTVLVEETTRNQYTASGYTDTDIVNGKTYYYATFPYSTKGKYGQATVTSAVAMILDPVLNNNSWAAIEEAGRLGLAKTLWNIGDEKTFELPGMVANSSIKKEMIVQIADFDHDDLVTGGKAPITFICKYAMYEKTNMMTTTSNAGGYSKSIAYTQKLPEILNNFPDDLRPLVKKVKKPTVKPGYVTSVSIETINCDLFLLSPIEVGCNDPEMYPTNEGKRYPIFTLDDGKTLVVNESRKRTLVSSSGGVEYWLRSPKLDRATDYAPYIGTWWSDIDSRGANGSRQPYNVSSAVQAHLCFGFCI